MLGPMTVDEKCRAAPEHPPAPVPATFGDIARQGAADLHGEVEGTASSSVCAVVVRKPLLWRVESRAFGSTR